MTLREITVEDLPTLFEVRIATWHNPDGAEELERLGITPASVASMIETGSHRGWLAEVDRQIVGFAMGDRTNGEMWVIAVLAEYEGRGIGKALLAAVEFWLATNGWDEVWLTTDTDETLRAVGFYRHLGWRDWKFQDGDRFMRKRLPAAP